MKLLPFALALLLAACSQGPACQNDPAFYLRNTNADCAQPDAHHAPLRDADDGVAP